MKTAQFEYYAPTTVEESLTLLAAHGYDAKVLAGGQSLVPMMNFRLVQPSILVDLNNIPELAYIKPDENGGLRLGAMTRPNRLPNPNLYRLAKRLPAGGQRHGNHSPANPSWPIIGRALKRGSPSLPEGRPDRR